MKDTSLWPTLLPHMATGHFARDDPTRDDRLPASANLTVKAVILWRLKAISKRPPAVFLRHSNSHRSGMSRCLLWV